MRVASKVFISLFVQWITHLGLLAQVGYVEALALRYQDELPPDLLNTRTAVIFLPLVSGRPSYEEKAWQQQIHRVHRLLKRAQVDAMMYVHASDIFLTPVITRLFIELLQKRAVKNLVLLSLFHTPEWVVYDFVFTTFDARDGYFVQPETAAWRMQGKDLDALYEQFRKEAYAGGARAQNFLIPDVHELYREVNFLANKAKRGIPYDIKNTTLAAAAFSYGGILAHEDTMAGRALQEENSILTTTLSRIYPSSYELLPFTGDLQVPYKKGYRYLLACFRGSDASIRRNINYPFRAIRQAQDDAPANNEMVYKFFLYRLYPREIFVGDRWDASPSLAEALENFLVNFKEH